MELSQLRIFRAVVDEGGITRAARKLHRVQSNVTTRVKQLEEELNVALFVRDGKRLTLSPQGKVFAGYAQRILALVDEAQSAVSDPTPRGVFTLGAMESTAAVRLPGPLTRYYQCYPQVSLQLRTGNPIQLTTALLAGEIDAALIAGPIPKGPLEHCAVFDEELVLVGAANQSAVHARSPLPATIIVFEQGCPHRRRLEQWYADRDHTPAKIIELSSYHAMLGCVVVGMGVALLPRSVLSTFPERRRLSIHALPARFRRLQTSLVWCAGTMTPNLEALIKILSRNRERDPVGG